MDLATIFGLVLAIGGILAGQALEGGHAGTLMQATAALIVFSGTIGAVLVGTPLSDVKTGLALLRSAFFNPKGDETEKLIKELLECAQVARKESILALERRVGTFSNDYMKTVFRFVIDGVDATTLREIFESELYLEEEHQNAGAKIFIDAGGFAPTVGIIGAVLGLIHIMENLSDTSKLGSGIAVAFVATVYGVGSANLLFLPLGNKIKRRIKMQLAVKEMILTGAIGIVSGLNPFLIEQKLRAYTHGPNKAVRVD